MPALLIRHHVAHYAAWKAVFDEDESTRRANGSQGAVSYTHLTLPTILRV